MKPRSILFAAVLALPLSLAAAPDLASFERKAEMNPKDPQAQFNLGVVAFQAKRLDVAKKAMAKAVKLSPKDAEAWELYGTILASDGSDGALDALRHSTDLEPKRAKAWMLQGKLLAANEDPKSLEAAADAYAHAAKAAPSDGRAWLNQGLVLARQGKDEKAVDALERASKLKGGESAERSLCVLFSKAGESKKALSACQDAASHDGRAEDWYNLSFAQQKLGKAAEARKSLQSALKADPEHAPSLYSLAFMDFEAGSADKALAGFQAAIKARKGDYPEAQYNAAVLLGDLGRYEEAAEIYRGLLKKDPANEDAKSNLAYVVETGVGTLIDQGKDAYERGDFDAAAKAWKHAAKLDPDNEQVKPLLAKANAKTQSAADKAAAAAKKSAAKAVAKKLKAEDEKVLKQGLAALSAGKNGEAMRLLDFYLKKNPGDKKAQTALFKARAQVRQKTDELLQGAARELVAGDRTKAKALANQALEIDPGNARARKLLEQAGQAPAVVNADAVRKLYYAGVEQYLAGDLAGAVETWKKVLAQDPKHLDANRSLARAQLELAALKSRGK